MEKSTEGQGQTEMKRDMTGYEKNKGKKRVRKHRCKEERNTGGEKRPIMVTEINGKLHSLIPFLECLSPKYSEHFFNS